MRSLQWAGIQNHYTLYSRGNLDSAAYTQPACCVTVKIEIGRWCPEPRTLAAASKHSRQERIHLHSHRRLVHASLSGGQIFPSCEPWFVALLQQDPAHRHARKAGGKGFQCVVNTHAKLASRGCQALKTFNPLPEGGARLRGCEGSFSAPLGEEERKVWSCPYFFLNRIPLKCLRSESNARFLFWTWPGSHVSDCGEEYLCPPEDLAS